MMKIFYVYLIAIITMGIVVVLLYFLSLERTLIKEKQLRESVMIFDGGGDDLVSNGKYDFLHGNRSVGYVTVIPIGPWTREECINCFEFVTTPSAVED